ncbi:MAG: TenA family protein [Candidatus Competibacterales bacterium]|nr:TenA family protein [Candidatus Competibacterales bacterium]
MLHRRLWNDNLDLVRASLAEPFVQGLGDGTLEGAAFRRYVAQDAFFLRAFLRAYALAAAKCERPETVARLCELMGGVLEELDLHARYARELDIELHEVEPLLATRAYTDFLLHTAWSADSGQILAAMTPCMRLYAWLGEQFEPALRPDHPYADWIRTYADPSFHELARRLESLLDELAQDTAEVRAAYRHAMRCEQVFFAAPLAPA